MLLRDPPPYTHTHTEKYLFQMVSLSKNTNNFKIIHLILRNDTALIKRSLFQAEGSDKLIVTGVQELDILVLWDYKEIKTMKHMLKC